MSVITYKDLGEIVPTWIDEQEMLKGILSEITLKECAVVERTTAKLVSTGREFFFSEITGAPDCPIKDDPVLCGLIHLIRLAQDNLKVLRKRLSTEK
jgi:hypothetical protein